MNEKEENDGSGHSSAEEGALIAEVEKEPQ